MKLKYQTGIATFIQFVVVSILALINQISSIIFNCVEDSSSCVENIIPSFWYFIITAIVFAGIWMLGHKAQELRKKWVTLALILLELGVLRVAYHNAKHATDALGLISSIINIALTIWIIVLAVRLLRASDGGRVVAKQRPRQRRRATAHR